MHIDDRGWVSVAELIIYIPLITACGIVCTRHGFHRTSGFIYTLVLCLIRIVGAIIQLLTYDDQSSGLIKAAIIIDSIGLSPLLFATLGLLSRLIGWATENKKSIFSNSHVYSIHIVILVALVLSIVGGTSTKTTPDGTVDIPATSKAGSILYVAAFAAEILICLISIPSWSYVPMVERRAGIAVLCAFPFIGARILYSVLAIFLHDNTFSLYNGSVAAYVAMAVVEEMIVVMLYVVLGFLLPRTQGGGSGEVTSRKREASWKQGV